MNLSLAAVAILSLVATPTATTTTAFVPSPTFGTTKTSPSSATAPLQAATLEAPVRNPEPKDRVEEVRERFRKASADAAKAKGCIQDGSEDVGKEWWRTPLDETYRDISSDEPLRVVIAGGGVAGLVAAAACHAKGMKVAIFEQASQYAPYGGPIQIQSNALRALERINPEVCDEIRKAGTVTADRVSGLKIGYEKGVFLGLGKQYEKGDWLVRFDTLQPALQAGLYPTGKSYWMFY